MIVEPKAISLKNGLRLSLRSPTASDGENFLNHLRISHAEAFQNLNQPSAYWDSVSREQEAKILADSEAAPDQFMIVALHEQQIVGGLGFFGGRGEFLKHNGRIGMSLQQAFCSLGLGTEMMRFALEKAAMSGFYRVELSVRTYNAAGIALYERFGFQRVGILRHVARIDGGYVDEYLYQLILG